MSVSRLAASGLSRHWGRTPASVAFSCCSRPCPRRRQGQSSHVRPQSCLGAPGTLGRRQRAIGVYFALETGQERGTGRLGRFFGITLGVEAVGSQAGAKRSLCRGQAPSIMHSDPSLPVATPPVAFWRPRAATRTQIRGAGYSSRWTRDGRSGVEPLSDSALIDSQHFSQEHSQQCSQTSSRGDFIGRESRSAALRGPATHSNTHSNTHSPRSRPCGWKGSVGATRGAVSAPVVANGPADGHDRVRRTCG